MDSLMNKAQVKLVQRHGESIVYNHNSGVTALDLKSFPSIAEYNSKDKDDKRKDKITFSNLVLAETPTQLDIIEYDGYEWQVRTWSKIYSLWMVEAEKNKRNKVFK